MNTLSVLLPVYNAHHSLEPIASEVLEMLCELPVRFELAILDDGSTDDTAELAYELAACYPQVRVLRHPVRLGLSEAIQTGLDQTPADVILISDEDYSLEPDDLRAVWQLRDIERRRTDYGSTRRTMQEPWMEKLLAWLPRGSRSERGFLSIRRAAFEQFRLAQAMDTIKRLDRNSVPSRPVTTMRSNVFGKLKSFARGD